MNVDIEEFSEDVWKLCVAPPLDQSQGMVSEIYYLGTMNICTKWNANPSNKKNIGLNVNQLVAQQEKSGDQQSQQASSSGDHEGLYNISCQSIQ